MWKAQTLRFPHSHRTAATAAISFNTTFFLLPDFAPAYNLQTAVDAEPAIIVTQKVTSEANDQRSLLPMEAAQPAVASAESINLIGDAGYSNGEQAEPCERAGKSFRTCPPLSRKHAGLAL